MLTEIIIIIILILIILIFYIAKKGKPSQLKRICKKIAKFLLGGIITLSNKDRENLIEDEKRL